MPEQRFNFWGIGGALMLASSTALFADLTWLRVAFASLLLWIGISCVLRAVKPHWFLTPGYEDKRFNGSNLLEVVQIPPKARWYSWGLVIPVCVVLSALTAFIYYHVYGGQKTQRIISIAVAAPSPIPDPTEAPVKAVPQKPPATSKASPIIEMAPTFGNLPERANDLANDILFELSAFGWSSADNRHPNWATQQEYNLWHERVSSDFRMRFFKRVADIRNEFAQLHIRDEELDEFFQMQNDRDESDRQLAHSLATIGISHPTETPISPGVIEEIAQRLQVMAKEAKQKEGQNEVVR